MLTLTAGFSPQSPAITAAGYFPRFSPKNRKKPAVAISPGKTG
jgi:hypothetical protein